MPRFEVLTRVDAPPEIVFAYSLDVDVHTASMSGSAEQAVAGVTTGHMKLGDQVTWRARHFGLWWRMTSRITEYDRPRHFVDEQLAGPFARWRHVHHFDPDGAGGTLMRDTIEFASPYWIAGRLAEKLVLVRYTRRLIAQRNLHLASVVERIARPPEAPDLAGRLG